MGFHKHIGGDRRDSFQHWYRDNSVYFITARVRDRQMAFASEAAKAIFWQKFEQYAAEFEFKPFVVSLLDNHWHGEGYFRHGKNLGLMMQRLHGSVAKLVNDLLPTRIPSFWSDTQDKNYFDGCLRDEKQGRLTYRYVLTQCRRHGICDNPADYRHTRVYIPMEKAIIRATQLDAYMRGVRYKRYHG